MSKREIGASHFAKDIRDLLACLVAKEVEFMVVGGEAVICHNRVDGIEFDSAWKRCEPVAVVDKAERLIVRYIGMDDLIKNKQAAARPKDLDALRYLTAVRRRRCRNSPATKRRHP